METITAGSMDTLPPVLRRPPVPRPALSRDDPEQLFVAALRAAAPRFAAAAGAVTAVVAEAVPPARHRRARCRVVLLAPDGSESELVFLGSARRAGPGSPAVFAASICRWLAEGQRRDGAWVVADPDARGGAAVDVASWVAAR